MIRELKYQRRHRACARARRVAGAGRSRERERAAAEAAGARAAARARLRERGFNQAAALARYAGAHARRFRCAPRACSRRARYAFADCARAWMQRHRNVRGAFAVSGARRAAQVVRRRARGHRRRRHDHRQHALRELRACAAGGGRQPGGSAGRRWRVSAATQARPAFFSASSGGPSNFSSGTLPV